MGARWRLAHLLDRLPGRCWGDLGYWAANGDGFPPLRRNNRECRKDVPRCGTCWCGKFQTSDGGA